LQATGRGFSGLHQINLFLLQSSVLHDSTAANSSATGTSGNVSAGYRYVQEHPVLHYLPTKLGEFIGDNYAEELKLPTAQLQERCMWTVSGLNYILTNVLVGDLLVFGAIEHESELFEGNPRIKCYPFESYKHHGKNPQVHNFQFIETLYFLMHDNMCHDIVTIS
jgi:hypothetical protein